MRKIEKRIKELEQKVEQQEKLIDFLSKHNKDDLAKVYGCGWYSHKGYIIYLFNGVLNQVELPFVNCAIKIIENKYDYAIVELSTILNYKRIWKLDKRSNVMVDIQNEYSQNKPTEDKND